MRYNGSMSKENLRLDQIIEGVLFVKGDPVKRTDLAKWLGKSMESVNEALEVLRSRLNASGLTLVETESELRLATRPELNDLFRNLVNSEQNESIGQAGSETLAIILYKGPITRSEIDHIRGVNSNYILRQLTMRGLVEKRSNGTKTSYQVTADLLGHLGISTKSELPNYDAVLDRLEAYQANQEE